MAGTVVPKGDVRAALGDILGWDDMARSGQLARFLAYIVEAKLDGREDAIKAYSIAVDVFGRPESFDPQADPIVRVQARRLRALLDQYYAENEHASPVRIRLPVGRYVPEFDYVDNGLSLLPDPVVTGPGAEERPSATRPKRGDIGWWPLIVMAASVLVVVLAGVAVWSMRMPSSPVSSRPEAPEVAVVEFQNLADLGHPAEPGTSPALALVTSLRAFDGIDVSYRETGGADTAVRGPTDGRRHFVLSGVIRADGDQMQYGASLVEEGADGVIWSHAVSIPAAQNNTGQSAQAAARALALMVASPRGPIDAPARTWLAQQADLDTVADAYLCRVQYQLFLQLRSLDQYQRSRACTDGVLAADPDDPVGLAMSAALLASAVSRGIEPLEELAMAEEMANRAVNAAPTRAFVWAMRARVMSIAGKRAQAVSDAASAVQLNPADGDALAFYAQLLSFTPNWEQGVANARTATLGTPEPPPWYYLAPALNAFRQDQFALALRYAETVSSTDSEIGPAIAVASAGSAGTPDAINRYLPSVIENPNFRAQGVMRRLARLISDPQLLGKIRVGLLKASVPSTALDGPF